MSKERLKEIARVLDKAQHTHNEATSLMAEGLRILGKIEPDKDEEPSIADQMPEVAPKGK